MKVSNICCVREVEKKVFLFKCKWGVKRVEANRQRHTITLVDCFLVLCVSRNFPYEKITQRIKE